MKISFVRKEQIIWNRTNRIIKKMLLCAYINNNTPQRFVGDGVSMQKKVILQSQAHTMSDCVLNAVEMLTAFKTQSV